MLAYAMLEGNFCESEDLLCVLRLPANLAGDMRIVQDALFYTSDFLRAKGTESPYTLLPLCDPIIPLGIMSSLPNRRFLLEEAKTYPVTLSLTPTAHVYPLLRICGVGCVLHAPHGIPCSDYMHQVWGAQTGKNDDIQAMVYLADIHRSDTVQKIDSHGNFDAVYPVLTDAIQQGIPGPSLKAQTRALSLDIVKIDPLYDADLAVPICAGRRYTQVFSRKLSRRDAKV